MKVDFEAIKSGIFFAGLWSSARSITRGIYIYILLGKSKGHLTLECLLLNKAFRNLSGRYGAAERLSLKFLDCL